MIELIFDTNCYKILSFFAIHEGAAFRRNEIKEKTRLNNVPLDKALNKLALSHTLSIDHGTYRLNEASKQIKRAAKITLRQYQALNDLPFDGYLLLIDVVEALSQVKGLELYLRDDPSKTKYQKSGIEITIVTPKGVDMGLLSGSIKKLTGKYRKQVEIHDFLTADLQKRLADPKIKEMIDGSIKII